MVADDMPIHSDKKPVQKAKETDKWTEILFRALTSRVARRWRFVSFRGAKGGEWRGVVDVLAIRKDTSRSNHQLLKSGDLFEIILVQMKGGSARKPVPLDIKRLKAVAERYGAKEIVLFEWNKSKKHCVFSRLDHSGKWEASTAKKLFG
jgi:hypothetical protein